MALIFSKILNLIVTVARLLHQSGVSGMLQSNQMCNLLLHRGEAEQRNWVLKVFFSVFTQSGTCGDCRQMGYRQGYRLTLGRLT